MGQVYLDNAATTALDARVKQAMIAAMELTGNPSSVHSVGRKSKALVESSRTRISKYFKCQPGEITFTSGGTEANNLAILGTVEVGEIKTIISSKIEHPSVIESIKKAQRVFNVSVKWVKLHADGAVDMDDLAALLSQNPNALVSLMAVNNEIGNILNLKQVGEMCHSYGAIFHTDTVQAVGHIALNLSELPVDLLTCSAHKLHGPKGVGFLFHRRGIALYPQVTGGAQERDARGGTENLVGIAGFDKGLELAFLNFENTNPHITDLKAYFIQQLTNQFPQVLFNGQSKSEKNSVNTILSLNFPNHSTNEMILFQLDLKGIMVSGGSACSSGSIKGSHVLSELETKGASVRISFCSSNTKQEIDRVINALSEILKEENN